MLDWRACLALVFKAAMVKARFVAVPGEMLVDDPGPAFPPVDDLTSLQVIQFAGFFREAGICQSARREQQVRMVIALVAGRIRGMNDDIHGAAMPDNDLIREISRQGQALAGSQLIWQGDFKLACNR